MAAKVDKLPSMMTATYAPGTGRSSQIANNTGLRQSTREEDLIASGNSASDAGILPGTQASRPSGTAKQGADAPQQDIGPEVFAPAKAPRMHRSILAGSVPLIPLGGMTWLAEIASEPEGEVAGWTDDLLEAHVTATDGIADLLKTHFGQEHSIFANWADCPWPTGFGDAVNSVEQWLPGDCLRYPALVGWFGVALAVDECIVFSKDIGATRYLGITISDWEAMMRAEVKHIGGDQRWLDVGFSSLCGCICLQNLEKAMLGDAPRGENVFYRLENLARQGISHAARRGIRRRRALSWPPIRRSLTESMM